MFISKRVIKKRKNRKKVIVIGLVVLTVLFAVCVAAYFWLVSQRPLYISPLAFSGGGSDVLFDTDSSEDAVKRSLTKYAIAYDRIQSSSDSAILVTLKSGEEVVMSKTRNLDEQISSLQLILFRLTMEGKRVSQFDLRYDKPVIKFR